MYYYLYVCKMNQTQGYQTKLNLSAKYNEINKHIKKCKNGQEEIKDDIAEEAVTEAKQRNMKRLYENSRKLSG